MSDTTLDRESRVEAIGSSGIEFTLNPNRLYIVFHTGKDSSGEDSVVDVFLQTGGSVPTADYSNGTNKMILQSGTSVPVPPKTSTLKAITASGEVVVTVFPGTYNPLVSEY